MKKLVGCTILSAAVMGMFAIVSPARAVVFSDVNLGAAGPNGFNFVVFQTGPTSFSASNSGTLFGGNVGMATGGSTNFSGNGTISGMFYVDPAASTQSNLLGQMHITGGVQSLSLSQAVTDVTNANTMADSLLADFTYASLGSSAATLNAIGALNVFGGRNTVYDVTGNIKITNHNNDLTILGSANDYFIINVGGDVTVSNGAIHVAGGMPVSHVLFNLTGDGSSVNLTNASSSLDGDFLAPKSGQAINLTPGTVNGAVIGYNIHTSSGPIVNADPFICLDCTGSVPEPASLSLLGLGAAAMLIRRRRA